MEDAVPGETRDEEHLRGARNYVRKLLRGRAWVVQQLNREQRDRASYRYTKKMRALVFGISQRVSMHTPFERANDFIYPERLWFALLLSLWIQ
eukprot:3542622-Prymnesium_polylepis.1